MKTNTGIIPDFIIAGAQKSGTTYLWSVLRQHPCVFLPNKKEINYFVSGNDNYENGRLWYESHFSGASTEQVVGEASPRYLFYDFVPARIHQLNPHMKLIFLLRNPVQRAESHYLHNLRDGIESLSFIDALKEEGMRITRGAFDHRAYSYVSRGFYARQLRAFLACFPRENILVMKSEAFFEHTQWYMDKVTDFLGVSELPVSGLHANKNARKVARFAWLNLMMRSQILRLLGTVLGANIKGSCKKFLHRINTKNTEKSYVTLETKALILNKTMQDTEELEALVGLDCSDWKR